MSSTWTGHGRTPCVRRPEFLVLPASPQRPRLEAMHPSDDPRRAPRLSTSTPSWQVVVTIDSAESGCR